MTRCETCCGEGTVIEFHRFAGEYMAGEPVEVECPDCLGIGLIAEEVVCVGCDQPFDVNGYCERCDEHMERIEERPLGEGWHRWAA